MSVCVCVCKASSGLFFMALPITFPWFKNTARARHIHSKRQQKPNKAAFSPTLPNTHKLLHIYAEGMDVRTYKSQLLLFFCICPIFCVKFFFLQITRRIALFFIFFFFRFCFYVISPVWLNPSRVTQAQHSKKTTLF